MLAYANWNAHVDLEIAFPTLNFYDTACFLASANERWQETQKCLEQTLGGHEEVLLLQYWSSIKAERNSFLLIEGDKLNLCRI